MDERLRPLLGRTLAVVAHPDDEVIACGGLLQMAESAAVVFCTDGAPEDDYWWKKHGSRAAYARLRQQEARAAAAAIGVHDVFFLGDHERTPHEFADQNLYRVLDRAFDELLSITRGFQPDALVTLSYEGGHPDHDASGFLATRVGERLGVPVWEAPLYHRIETVGHYQDWTCPTGESIDLVISGDALARKQAMLSQYRSQFTSLPNFKPELERFRPRAAYDYAQRPHPGRLNYEVWQWPMSGDDVADAFRRFDEQRARAA